jgi:hypothetical protein
VAVAEGRQFAQGSDVTVHAEHGVGRDELGRTGAVAQHPRKRRDIAVRIDVYLGTRKPRCVDQACVVQGIGEHGITSPDECGQSPEARHVSRGEVQCARCAHECRQPCFQRFVGSCVAADERRRTRAGTVGVESGFGCLGDGRMARQPEIVVAAEREQAPAVHLDVRSLRAGHDAPSAGQPLRLELPQAQRQVRHRDTASSWRAMRAIFARVPGRHSLRALRSAELVAAHSFVNYVTIGSRIVNASQLGW